MELIKSAVKELRSLRPEELAKQRYGYKDNPLLAFYIVRRFNVIHAPCIVIHSPHFDTYCTIISASLIFFKVSKVLLQLKEKLFYSVSPLLLS